MSSLFRRHWSHLAYLSNLLAPRFFLQNLHVLPSVSYVLKPSALQALQINFLSWCRWFFKICCGHSLLSNILWHALHPCELSFSVPTHVSTLLHLLQKLSTILSSVRAFFFWISGRVTSFWHSRHLVQVQRMEFLSGQSRSAIERQYDTIRYNTIRYKKLFWGKFHFWKESLIFSGTLEIVAKS